MADPRNTSEPSLLQRFLRRFRARCETCGERALRQRNFIRATCVDAEGERYPDALSYPSCDSCGAHAKRFHDGRVVVPSEDEWQLRATSLDTVPGR